MAAGGAPLTKLAKFREERGWTLADLSDLTGMSEAMWSRVERRQRRMAPETKVAVAHRLGVRVRDLFDPEPLDDAEAATE